MEIQIGRAQFGGYKMIIVTGKTGSGKTTFINMLQKYLPDTKILESMFPEGSDAFVIEIINRGVSGISHDEEDIDIQINNNNTLEILEYKAREVAKEYLRERPI